MTRLDIIERFFEDYDFKGREVKISQCEKILDTDKFVKSHINILKANSGNGIYLPYYHRLEKLYLLLKSEL